MKGHACKNILLQKKFLLKAGSTPIRNKSKEEDMEILGKGMVTVKCQYIMAIRRHKTNLRIYQYFQQGQAPGREIHPGGLTIAEVIKGQQAHILTGCEEAWTWQSAIERLRGEMTLLCKFF